MDELVEEIKSLQLGYRMGGEIVNVVCYADDAIIIAENNKDLQTMLNRLHDACKKYNMEISIDKTKCMTFSKTPVTCNLAIENKNIEQVSNFRYLGVDLVGGADLCEEIQAQVNKANAISGALKSKIWKNKDMAIKSKMRIYKACVRPVMTYGVEARADTVRTKQKLRTTEMRTLRTIAGKTLRDRVRNTRIREICEADDIVRWSRQRRREWYSHVQRMDITRLPNIVLHNQPHGTRPRGRPPKRWKDSWESTSQEEQISAETDQTGLA